MVDAVRRLLCLLGRHDWSALVWHETHPAGGVWILTCIRCDAGSRALDRAP